MLSLALLDVRLVERVDAQRPAGDGGGVLPGQELRAERPDDGRAGSGAVVSVAPRRRAGRRRPARCPGASGVLDDDGQQALAPLAGGLGDELLGPVAEADEPAPAATSTSLSRPETAPPPSTAPSASAGESSCRARPAAPRPSSSSAPMSTPARAGGHQPERGQRAVAAADVGVGEEDGARALLLRRLLERRARVGHDDDAARRVDAGGLEGGAGGPAVAVGLDRPAGLRADDDDRALELDQGRADLAGVGAVDDDERHPGRRADDLGGQRGAAHAAEHDAVDALGGELLAQGRDLRTRRRPGSTTSSQPSRTLASGVASGPHSVASLPASAAARPCSRAASSWTRAASTSTPPRVVTVTPPPVTGSLLTGSGRVAGPVTSRCSRSRRPTGPCPRGRCRRRGRRRHRPSRAARSPTR